MNDSGDFTLVYWRHLEERRRRFNTANEAFEFAKRGWSEGKLSFEAIEGPEGDVVLDHTAFLGRL